MALLADPADLGAVGLALGGRRRHGLQQGVPHRGGILGFKEDAGLAAVRPLHEGGHVAGDHGDAVGVGHEQHAAAVDLPVGEQQEIRVPDQRGDLLLRDARVGELDAVLNAVAPDERGVIRRVELGVLFPADDEAAFLPVLFVHQGDGLQQDVDAFVGPDPAEVQKADAAVLSADARIGAVGGIQAARDHRDLLRRNGELLRQLRPGSLVMDDQKIAGAVKAAVELLVARSRLVRQHIVDRHDQLFVAPAQTEIELHLGGGFLEALDMQHVEAAGADEKGELRKRPAVIRDRAGLAPSAVIKAADPAYPFFLKVRVQIAEDRQVAFVFQLPRQLQHIAVSWRMMLHHQHPQAPVFPPVRLHGNPSDSFEPIVSSACAGRLRAVPGRTPAGRAAERRARRIRRPSGSA